MLVEKILQIANLKCEENLGANTLLIYLNQGINRLNIDTNLKLPPVESIDAKSEYDVSDDEFVNRIIGDILSSYVAYCIRQNEGYAVQENTFYTEFSALKMEFATKYSYLVKQEYQLDSSTTGAYRRQENKKIIKNRVRLW